MRYDMDSYDGLIEHIHELDEGDRLVFDVLGFKVRCRIEEVTLPSREQPETFYCQCGGYGARDAEGHPRCKECGALIPEGYEPMTREEWNQTQEAHDGKMYPPDWDKAQVHIEHQVRAQQAHDFFSDLPKPTLWSKVRDVFGFLNFLRRGNLR